MTALYRVRTGLSGFVGGPGVSTMYFLDIMTAIPSVRAFWESVIRVMPTTVTAQVESAGDIIESTTGELTGQWSVDPVLPSFGTEVGPYSAASGAVVTWLTDTIANGRRVRGRTFIVPMSAAHYDAAGSLTTPAVTLLANSAQAIVFEQSLSLVIWHRPVQAAPATGTSPAVAARAGSHAIVTAYRVPDLSAVLRSRRD